jgi:hypothetical protein
MPSRNEVELKTGLIYMIECKDSSIKQFYVGSTMRTFSERRNEHKCASKKEKNKLYDFINNNGKWHNWNLTVIEYIDVEKDYEIRIFEQLWIETLQPQLNNNRAYRTEFEHKLQLNKFSLINNKKIVQCSKCNKTYTKGNKTIHLNSKYCKNYISTSSDSDSDIFIRSDTDI